MNTLRTALILLALMQPQAPGAVQGIVLKYGSGEPISGARVELIRTDGKTPQSYSSVTAPDGTFTIQNARPGEYRIAASRTGYLRREFGQRSWDGSGLVLSLDGNHMFQNLNIELRPAAAIAGRVTDREGDPVVGAEVRAMVTAYRNGQRILRAVQSTITNDLGEYRLFGLPAGQYYISAASNAGDIPFNILIASPSPTAPPFSTPGPRAAIYYPSTQDSRTATPIDLTSGGDFGGVNITITPFKPHHIRGNVPGGMARVTLVPNDPGMTPSSRDVDASNGPFDFPNVASGEYTLVARSGEMLGTASVSVGDGDVDNVTVGLGLGVPVPTRVSFDDRKPGDIDSDLEDVTFSLIADPGIPGADPDTYGPFSNGFLAFGVLLRQDYRIALLRVRRDASPVRLREVFIKSIHMGTRDVLNDGLRVDDPANIPPLEIVLGTRSGTLNGTVVSEKQKPQANATVLLIPDAGRRRWYDSFRTATTDISGRFVLDRIPPGDYVALSWEEVEEGTWMDPEFMKRYQQSGKHIHINEGGNPSLNITAIP
jgi:5-hydroxyisourate hydrolase-like protein (transthyretin family)